MSSGDLELHGHSDIFFLGVNRSGPGTNSTTNHRFYMALGQLHGPWCKQPLSDIIQNDHNGNMSFGPVYKESINL